jgi:hypothetical protein
MECKPWILAAALWGLALCAGPPAEAGWLGVGLGFEVTNPTQAGWAQYVLNVMLGSLVLDPQWEARIVQETNAFTGANQMQQAMAQTIARHAGRQASAGGLNHPNPGVPWNLRDKWKVEAGPRQAYGSAITGNKYACDPSWGCRQVDIKNGHHWINNEGRVVAGPGSGNPPDYTGRWRPMTDYRP